MNSRVEVRQNILGFPKLGRTLLGGFLYNKDDTILGYIEGTPSWGNLHMGTATRRMQRPKKSKTT